MVMGTVMVPSAWLTRSTKRVCAGAQAPAETPRWQAAVRSVGEDASTVVVG
jgi:hypothetical protein